MFCNKDKAQKHFPKHSNSKTCTSMCCPARVDDLAGNTPGQPPALLPHCYPTARAVMPCTEQPRDRSSTQEWICTVLFLPRSSPVHHSGLALCCKCSCRGQHRLLLPGKGQRCSQAVPEGSSAPCSTRKVHTHPVHWHCLGPGRRNTKLAELMGTHSTEASR